MQLLTPQPIRAGDYQQRGSILDGYANLLGGDVFGRLLRTKLVIPFDPLPPCYTSTLDCEGRSGNGRFESRLSIKLFARALSSPSIST